MAPALRTALSVGLILATTSVTHGFDRDQIHRDQLSGLNLTQRTYISTPPALPQASSAGSDLRLSEAGSPAMFTQDHVRLAVLANSDWLAVWNDNRSGSEKIWQQRLTTGGTLVGANVLAAGSTTGADFIDPEILTDSVGLVYLFYRDRTNGLIYGSRYNADLTENLAPFVVNDSSNSAFAGPYDVAVFPDGRTVVVWENYGVTGSTIQMRVYNAAGATVAGPTTVHSDASSSQRWVPSVAVQSGSGYLVAWEDYRNGQADIYARLFTGAGASIGNDFALVPSPESNYAQYAPQVAYSSLNQYVIGWIDRRTGQEVYLQRYDPISGLAGANTLISSGDSVTTNWDLNLAVATSGKLLASWGASQSTNLIQSQRFGAALTTAGSLLSVNLDADGHRWGPAARFAAENNFGVVWTEFVSEDADAQMMAFDTLGNRLFGSEIRLNDDAAGSPVASASVISGTGWWWISVFSSRRADAGDIYLQRFGYFGGLVGTNVKVNQDIGSNLQSEPTAAAADSQVLIAWVDGRAVNAVSGQRIYGRLSSRYGTFYSNEFIISDSASVASKRSPRVASRPNGRALVVWLDNRDGSYQVWGHWRNADGSNDGADFRVSTVATDTQNDDLCIGTDNSDRFWVSWLDHGTASPSVKAHLYNTNKSEVGSFTWTPTETIEEMSAAVTPAGALAVVFTTLNGAAKDIYIAALSSTGTQTLAPYNFNDLAASDAETPSVSIDNAGYIAASWIDHRAAQTRVWLQAFTSGFLPIGANQQMTNGTPEYVVSPTVYAAVGNAWTVWIDPRENGASVWGNYYVYEPTDVADNPNDRLPSSFALAQNYPNPFNPSTVIEFALPSAANARVEIFNSLGRKVATLLNGPMGAGTHRIIWNGCDDSGDIAASGVYLYRVTADGTALQKKMLLVK